MFNICKAALTSIVSSLYDYHIALGVCHINRIKFVSTNVSFTFLSLHGLKKSESLFNVDFSILTMIVFTDVCRPLSLSLSLNKDANMLTVYSSPNFMGLI